MDPVSFVRVWPSAALLFVLCMAQSTSTHAATTHPWSQPSGMTLAPFRKNVWVAERPFKFFGLADCGTKMTVIKLRDGSLWVHSPVELDAETKKAVDRLGKVKHIVSPNFEHLRYAKMWIEAYQNAQSYAPVGLPQVHPEIGFKVELGDRGVERSPWEPEIVMCHLDMERNLPFVGHPYFGEVVFCHVPSKTLISADTFWNIPPNKGFEASVVKFVLDRMFMPLYRHLQCRRSAVKRIVPSVLEWDFTAIIPCHGRVVGSDMLTPALGDGDRALMQHAGDVKSVLASHVGLKPQGVPIGLRPWCWLAGAVAVAELLS